jgi:hypothetical protein
METLRTYLSAALLTDPLSRYEAVDEKPLADVKAALMELVVRAQARRAKARMTLAIFFRDILAYGLGACHLPFVKEIGTRTVRTSSSRTIAGVELFDRVAGQQEDFTMFEGTKPENIDPYKMLPDPDVPFHRASEGSYFGWVHRTSVENLLDMERSNPDMFFNVRYTLHLSDATTRVVTFDDGRSDKFGGAQIHEGMMNRPVDIIWMYVRVIPSEWKLGTSDYPERWLFGIAGDGIVIAAHRMGLDHNKNPIITAAPDTDGHGSNAVSKMEVIYGLQGASSFFYNTRSANVLKALNDMFIVDPNIVNVASMKTTGPGKLMYLKRSQWGEGKIDSAIKQFPVADVTAGLPGDVLFAGESSRRATGAIDQLAGIMQGGRERVSATEAQALQQGALSRMEFLAQTIDDQAFQDMGDQFAYNTRQFMSDETFVRVTGRHSQLLQETYGLQSVRVTPQDIDIYWEVLANDGTIPGAGNAQTWVQLFQAITTNESLMPQFDIMRMFKHIARILGARNLEEFVLKGGANIQPQVVPDEQAIAEANAGNAVPIGGELGLAA